MEREGRGGKEREGKGKKGEGRTGPLMQIRVVSFLKWNLFLNSNETE